VLSEKDKLQLRNPDETRTTRTHKPIRHQEDRARRLAQTGGWKFQPHVEDRVHTRLFEFLYDILHSFHALGIHDHA
jgi:hypothetical protein